MYEISVMLTLFSCSGCESLPNSIPVAALENCSSPRTGKYSLFNVSSAARAFSAWRTTGRTQGWPFSVL